MTANALEEDRQACTQAGMNDFIAKPAEPEVLLRTLARWLTAPPAPAMPPAEAPDPAAHPALDLIAGLRNVGGQRETYHQLLRRFADRHLADGDRLRRALGAGDVDGARLLAHSLKGSAAMVGAEPVRLSATHIERTVATCREVPDEELRELCRHLRVLGEMIRKVAAADDPSPAVPPATAPPARVPLQQRVRELDALLANDDYRACELWHELAESLRGSLGPGPVAELARLIAAFDLPTAQRRLRECGALDLAGAP